MALSEKAARSKDRATSAPNMQHRHFAFIAACIRDIPTPAARVEAASVFSAGLGSTNPALDGYRFRDACNCEPENYTLDELDRAVVHAALWLQHLRQERHNRGIEGVKGAAE